jgi:hypothetical protein
VLRVTAADAWALCRAQTAAGDERAAGAKILGGTM